MSRMSISIIGHVILTHQPASGSALNNTSFPPTVKVTANLNDIIIAYIHFQIA